MVAVDFEFVLGAGGRPIQEGLLESALVGIVGIAEAVAIAYVSINRAMIF